MNIISRLIPKTLENRAALRTATATVIAVLLAFAFHLDTPYWSGMTVIIVANLYTGTILDKAILRIIGTIIGAALGFFIAHFIVNSFFLFLLTNFLLITVASYHYIFARYAYAYLLAGLAAFIVVAQLAMTPDNAFFVAIWRPVEIGLGVLVSAASAFCIFPNHIKDNLKKQIEDIFGCLISELNHLKQALLTDDPAALAGLDFSLLLKKKLRKTSEMMAFLHREAGITREKINQLHVLLDLIYQLGRTLNYFILSQRDQNLAAINEKLQRPLSLVFDAIEEDLHNLRTVFFTQHNQQALRTSAAITAFDAEFLQQPAALANNKFYYLVSHLFRQLNGSITRLNALLLHQETFNKPNIHVLNTQDRLRRDPEVIKHSIKVGLAAVLALLFWLWSDWPGGLNGIISSLVISIKKNLFEIKQASIHRMLGCFLGGGTALGALAMTSIELYSFIWLVFILVWSFSYFSFKYTKYAYIGLQANIAVIITLAQGGGPPTDLAPPLERLGGVMIGIIASYLVANLIWRSDAITMLSKRLNKLFRLLAFNINQVLVINNDGIKIHDLNNLFWVCRSVIESFSNEHISHNTQGKLKKLTHAFDELIIIHSTFNHILVRINQTEARESALQLGINLQPYEIRLSQIYQQADTDILGLQNQLDNDLTSIQRYSPNTKLDNEQLINLIAYIRAMRELARPDLAALSATLKSGGNYLDIPLKMDQTA